MEWNCVAVGGNIEQNECKLAMMELPCALGTELLMQGSQTIFTRGPEFFWTETLVAGH